MEIALDIPESLLDLLLLQAAEQEVTIEEIVTRAMQNFLERDENIGES